MAVAFAGRDLEVSCFPGTATISNQVEDALRNRGPDEPALLLLLEEPSRCDHQERGAVQVPILAGRGAEELVATLAGYLGRPLQRRPGRLVLTGAEPSLLDRPVRFDPSACPLQAIEGTSWTVGQVEYCLIGQLEHTRYASSGGSMDKVYGLRVDLSKLQDAPLGDALLALYTAAGLRVDVISVMTRTSFLGGLTEVMLHRHGVLVGPLTEVPTPASVPGAERPVVLPVSEDFGFPPGWTGFPVIEPAP
jgi:hypothetical protein